MRMPSTPLRLPHIHLGTVSGATARELYAHADIVLSTSLYETLPGTPHRRTGCRRHPRELSTAAANATSSAPDAEGRLVPSGDTHRLATALASTLTTPCR